MQIHWTLLAISEHGDSWEHWLLGWPISYGLSSNWSMCVVWENELIKCNGWCQMNLHSLQEGRTKCDKFETQCRFIRGQNTIDRIWLVKKLVERARNTHTPMYLCGVLSHKGTSVHAHAVRPQGNKSSRQTAKYPRIMPYLYTNGVR